MEDKGAHSCLAAMTFLSMAPIHQPTFPGVLQSHPFPFPLRLLCVHRLNSAFFSRCSVTESAPPVIPRCQQLTLLLCMCVSAGEQHSGGEH